MPDSLDSHQKLLVKLEEPRASSVAKTPLGLWNPVQSGMGPALQELDLAEPTN